jgi:hypothetical protein
MGKCALGFADIMAFVRAEIARMRILSTFDPSEEFAPSPIESTLAFQIVELRNADVGREAAKLLTRVAFTDRRGRRLATRTAFVDG